MLRYPLKVMTYQDYMDSIRNEKKIVRIHGFWPTEKHNYNEYQKGSCMSSK